MLAKLVILALIVSAVLCDLPVHCEFNQIEGAWTFKITQGGMDRSAPQKCVYNQQLPFPVVSSLNVDLLAPNVALDKTTGTRGTWTLIYDQGFEVTLENKKYFAFFNFTRSGSKVVSHCGETFTGWLHEVGVNSTNWACFKGVKVQGTPATTYEVAQEAVNVDATFKNNEAFIEKINKEQKSWVAASYAQFEGVKMSQLLRMSGKRVPKIRRDYHKKHVAMMRSQFNVTRSTDPVPDKFDWRTSSKCEGGCVSPVRNQASCGSCFAFSATGMLEARVRVQTQGKSHPIFSPQDDLNCDPYNQGCNGGFTFSVSKYGQDYGIATEECAPYAGRNMPCTHKCPDNTRTYVRNYDYIGGYYGACNVDAMQLAIFANGPISVDFEVYSDFYYYRSGVYHHTKVAASEPDPHFEETNHAVLAVGWGINEQGEKYWIVKNSWGSGWGMQGYFLIRRGTDECGIESAAVEAFPITN